MKSSKSYKTNLEIVGYINSKHDLVLSDLYDMICAPGVKVEYFHGNQNKFILCKNQIESAFEFSEANCLSEFFLDVSNGLIIFYTGIATRSELLSQIKKDLNK